MIPFPDKHSRIQEIFHKDKITLSLLREDEIHPTISGNKFRKLKYNLEEFSKGNYTSILTFGGAFSNHISATAAAGMEFGIKTIGFIRGEELENKISENPTLKFAQECGMELRFLSRSEYRIKSDLNFLKDLNQEFPESYILPEGGTNPLAIRGCEEMLNSRTQDFDFICVPVGTGGTIRGLLNSALPHQKVMGFPVLKDSDYLLNEIQKHSKNEQLLWMNSYHFGGYAKVSDKLIDFINDFKSEYAVTLDPIYSGKMIFGIQNLILQKQFPKNSKILAIHTGGIQGIEGMNQKLKKLNKTLIL